MTDSGPDSASFALKGFNFTIMIGKTENCKGSAET